MRRFAFFTLALLIGCSGSSFEVANPTVDSALETEADTLVDETCSTNVCGGCAKLDHAIGEVCGVCKAGQWQCDGKDTMLCDDPFTGPIPGVACGTCKSVTLSCGPDGKSAVCPADDANACGGCGTITAFPGTKCGTCKTLEYKCTVDNSGTMCPGDDHNGCMGCTALSNAPGKACGVCSSGSYKCDGTSATKCDDPVTTPAPGTVCGICNKSTFACSLGGTTTACTKPDDRTDGTETFYSSFTSQIWTLSGADGPNAMIGVAFTTARLGAITSVTLGLQRFESSTTATLPGTLRVQLIKGEPTSTPASGDILATTSLSGDSIPDLPSTTTVNFTGVTSLPAGSRVWIKLTDISDRYNYALLGGPASGPAHLSMYYSGTSSWAEYTSADPYLKVATLGCF